MDIKRLFQPEGLVALRDALETAVVSCGADLAWFSAVADGRLLTESFQADRSTFVDIEPFSQRVIADQKPLMDRVTIASEIRLCGGIPVLEAGEVVAVVTVSWKPGQKPLQHSERALFGISRLIVKFAQTLERVEYARAERDQASLTVQRMTEYINSLQAEHFNLQAQGQELVQANEELKNLADTDGLTQLKNHRAFYEQLMRRFRKREPIALAIFDIDSFKLYNDEFGHVEGDRTLQMIAKIVSDSVSSRDLAARYGGEELAIIFDSSNVGAAESISERIRANVEKHEWAHRKITLCAGISFLTDDVQSIDDLVKRADSALYAAKRSGKNRVLTWNN